MYCAPTNPLLMCAPMLSKEIIEKDNMARSCWSYLSDVTDNDNWVVHAEEAASHTPWRDDCDGLVITALQLCHAAALGQRYILLVCTDQATTPQPDHMIGACLDDDGVMWVVGDTLGPAYRVENCPHHAGYYWRLDERDEGGKPIWREGFPWQ